MFNQLFIARLESARARGEKEQGRNFGEIHQVFAEKWVDEGMMQEGRRGGKPAVQHGLNYSSMSEWVASDGEMERTREVGRQKRGGGIRYGGRGGGGSRREERKEGGKAEKVGRRREERGMAQYLNSVFPTASHIHAVCSPHPRLHTHAHTHS